MSSGDRRSLPPPPEESAGGVDEPDGSPWSGGDIALKARDAPAVRQLHPVGDRGAGLLESPGRGPWSGGDRRSLPPPPRSRPWASTSRTARRVPAEISPRRPGTRRRCGSCIRVGRPRRGAGHLESPGRRPCPAEIAAKRVGDRGAGLLEHAPAATRGASRGRRRAGRLAVVRRRSPLSGSETVTGARRR